MLQGLNRRLVSPAAAPEWNVLDEHFVIRRMTKNLTLIQIIDTI